jgi:hypothetical protein
MASYARPRPPLELPRPGRSAAPFAVLCIAALAFLAAPRLWPAAAIAGGLFGSAGGVRALVARRELTKVRRAADRLILQTRPGTSADALVDWRTRELTQPESRHELQRDIERTLRMLAPGRLPSASPLRRPAARRNAELFRLLADRLGDERPVAARGVVLAAHLLRDAASPLYNENAELLLPRALTRVLSALEP